MGKDEANTNPENMEADELPDVRAFEDEFTRSFLQSTEETRPGYYPFLSGTGAYKMDFPQGGTIDERAYSRDNESFESFLIGVKNNNIESLIDMKFYSYKKQGYEESSLDTLNGQFENKLQFEKETLEGRTLFTAELKEDNGKSGFVVFVQNNNHNGGIFIIYKTECITSISDAECNRIKEDEKEKIIKWFYSVKFVKTDDESE